MIANKALTKRYLNNLTYKTLGCCIEVHKGLGPGLLESVYHKCLKHEFECQGISFQSEIIVPVCYKGIALDADLRADFYVENCLVLEIKAIEGILPVHEAQLLTYMKLLDAPKGLLVNFNCTNVFHQGQKSYVNEIFRGLPDV